VAFRAGLTRSDDPALLFAQRLQQGHFTAQDFAIESLNQPGPRNALEYGLVLEQPLWNGAAEVTAPAMASHAKGEARATAQAALADALLDAVRRYVAYISARERVAADSVRLAAVRSAHAAAVERNLRGQIPNLDTLRTFAREAEGRERWLLSVRDLDLARRRLADVIGVAPADGDIPSPAPADPDAFLLPEGAAADSEVVPPELGAARERANRLGLEADRASHRLLPSLNGRASVSYYRDPEAGGEAERRWFAGLALDWPLFDGTQRWNEKKAASARADGARAELEGIRRELDAREEAARRDLEIAGPRRDAARAARQASDEALRLAVARYRAGLLPLDDLLAVDAEAAAARERHIEREADVELAGYTYLHATGRLK
jgi:outer membrane protein TolC